MLSHALALVHDITTITTLCHLFKILLQHNILIFHNFAWIWANLARRILAGQIWLLCQILPLYPCERYRLLIINITLDFMQMKKREPIFLNNFCVLTPENGSSEALQEQKSQT